jgi:hypothetical protein
MEALYTALAAPAVAQWLTGVSWGPTILGGEMEMLARLPEPYVCAVAQSFGVGLALEMYCMMGRTTVLLCIVSLCIVSLCIVSL